MPDHQATLLLAHGTPDVLSEMAPYLAKVTGGRPMPAAVIEELQHRYAEIGLAEEPLPEGPPLTRWTLKQGRHAGRIAIEPARSMSECATGSPTSRMCSRRPCARDGITQLQGHLPGPAELPHQRRPLPPGRQRRVREAWRWSSSPAGPTIRCSPRPSRLEAVAGLGGGLRQSTGTPRPHLFTAHAVPCRTIMSGQVQQARQPPPVPERPSRRVRHPELRRAPDPDPYPVECKRTAAHVAKALASWAWSDRDWFFAFQSQGIAGAPWIGPTVEDTFKALAEARATPASSSSPSASSATTSRSSTTSTSPSSEDRRRARPERSGAPRALNDSPTLIHALAEIAEGSYQADVDEAP